MPQITGIAGTWLSLLRREIASSDLLPKAYARYLPLLADALCFFLQRISPVRLQQILSRQMLLPASSATAQRVVSLLQQLPALHKLGQVVARDRRLKASFRRRLQQLETLTPQIHAAQVVRLLGKAFKNWQKAGIELAPEPLAEGSVAVIMPFVWRDAPGEPRQGVFKLLKPGIRTRLQEDLAILSELGRFLDDECAQLHLPALDYQDTFSTIRELLLHEIQFDEEQSNLVEAAAMYKHIEEITVPALFPFCSSKVTAMTRLFGDKISGNGKLERTVRAPLARTIIRALIAIPMFSSKSAALFHADPHAGNLLLCPNRQVGILDWSLTGRLSKRERIELIHLMAAVFTLDLECIENALQRLSQTRPDIPAMRRILLTNLHELDGRTFPGITWLTRLLDQLALEARVRLDANFLLFRKCLLTLDGVLADVSGMKQEARDALLDGSVLACFIEHWIHEWPRRFFAPFEDRSFSTHLSNADLFRLVWSAASTWLRQFHSIALARKGTKSERSRSGLALNSGNERFRRVV